MVDRPVTVGEIDEPTLRCLAARAARIDRLEAAAEDSGDLPNLRDRLLDRLVEEDFALADALAAWIAIDPEHAHLLRFLVVLPWQREGAWRDDVPRWVHILATHAELARPGLADPSLVGN